RSTPPRSPRARPGLPTPSHVHRRERPCVPAERPCLTGSARSPSPPRPYGVGSRTVTATDRLVWIDCEMTGLSLEADALVEIAALVTDFDLNVLGEGVDIRSKPPAEALAQMDEFVTTMHTKSGLITELDAGVSLEDAQNQVMAYIRE